jgi:hypothetical protein
MHVSFVINDNNKGLNFNKGHNIINMNGDKS